MKTVSLVAAFNPAGELLLGRRRDTGRWTLPGGGLEPGETPEQGAHRELREETGLRAKVLRPLDVRTLGETEIHTFRASVDGHPTGEADPDQEVDEWTFVDVSQGVPSDIADNAQGPPGANQNVLLDVFGFKKSVLAKATDDEDDELVVASRLRTGQPTSLTYHHSRAGEPTANYGERFGQHVEPHGQYMGYHKPSWGQLADHIDPRNSYRNTWHEYGTVHFQNPLVVDGTNTIDWKTSLSSAHGGRSGKKLSDHLRSLGHDGVIARSPTSGIMEMVNLSAPKEVSKPLPPDARPLAKTQRLAGFPKLGIEDRRETPYVDTKDQAVHKLHQVKWAYKQAMPASRSPLHEMVQDQAADDQARGILGGVSGVVFNEPKANVSYALTNNAERHIHGPGRTNVTAPAKTTDVGTKLHEDFHQMMRRVQHRHGPAARENLAYNLWHSIPDTERKAAERYAFHRNKQLPKGHLAFWEENLAILHNYLNDERERQQYHHEVGDVNTPGVPLHFYAQVQQQGNGIKGAFKHLQAATHRADQTWLNGKLFGPEKETEFRAPEFGRPVPRLKRPGELVDTFMGKAEADLDEVHRLLKHPDATERRLALKLAGVGPDHIQRAIIDEDPKVARAAYEHPSRSQGALMALAGHRPAKELALRALAEGQLTPDHLDEMYEAHQPDPAVVDALASHPHLPHYLLRRMIDDGAPRHAGHHPAMTSELAQEVYDRHQLTKRPQDREVLFGALSGSVSPDVARKALLGQDEGLRRAAATSPALPEDAAKDLLARGLLPNAHAEAWLRHALVTSPRATAQMLSDASRDSHPRVRAGVFQTQSPALAPEHVDAAIENGHETPLLMAARSPAWRPEHLQKLMSDKRPHVRAIGGLLRDSAHSQQLGGWLAQKGLAKAEEKEDRQHVVRALLGHDTWFDENLAAAAFLAGHRAGPDVARTALQRADGDAEKAALLAHGLEPKDHLKALRVVREGFKHGHRPLHKTETHNVQPAVEDARAAAEEIGQAVAKNLYSPIDLGGKHSSGTYLVEIEGGQHWLLKPGAGNPSPAAGVAEEPASQSRREAAFWRLTQDFGLEESVPECQLLLVDGREYAAIRLLPLEYRTLESIRAKDPAAPARLLTPYVNSGLAHRWAVLMYAAGDPDGHFNNQMAPPDGSQPVQLIDHGSAFAGPDFNPGVDPNSFVPAYLRAWAPEGFSRLAPDQKLERMARCGADAEADLREWVLQLDDGRATSTLARYGVEPGPTLARLAKLKAAVQLEEPDLAINRLWAGA